MQYFEYTRGLNHAWYAHILFWILVVLVSIVKLGVYSDSIFEDDNHYEIAKIYLQIIINITIGVVLVILGICFKRETPH